MFNNKNKSKEAGAVKKLYHCLDISQTSNELNVDTDTGLSTSEAEHRLTIYGPNQMRGGGRPSVLKILFRQVANLMTVILLAAVIVAFVTKDWIEAGVVIGVILLNSTIGFLQEFKAEKTMDALRKMSSPTSRVLRNGHQIVVPTIDLVPGDILYLESGDVVGADCRLFDIFNYEADEALLTGETLPVVKESDVLNDPEIPLGDRINLSFASTTVTKGRSKAIVYATGMSTEVGKIAKKLLENDKPKKTPLQKSMDRMAWILLGIAIVCVLIVFGANKFNIKTEVLLYAIGLAIATIPEGLVAVVTLTMSLGVRSLAKKRALVRRLVALESLGSITNICSDKTGTLTQSKMVLVRAWLPIEGFFRVSGLGFEPVGEVTKKRKVEINNSTGEPRVNFAESDKAEDNIRSYNNDVERRSLPSSGSSYAEETVTVHKDNISASFQKLVEAAALCNMSEVKKDERTSEWFGIGDPTEVALQVFASKLSMGKPVLITSKSASEGVSSGQWQLVCEYPFDSGIKRMSVVVANKTTGEKLVFLKGATERVVPCCSKRQDGQEVLTIDSDSLQSYLDPRIEEMGRDGLRVLSIAYRHLTPEEEDADMNKADREHVETNMTFLGLVGIYDPPRPESLPSVMECYRAGIQVTMLTGDHPETAAAIAKQVGILQDQDDLNHGNDGPSDHAVSIGPLVMTAREFDRMTDEEIDALPELPHVIARCSPETKVKMIQALHRRDGIVAMTGDGVNDSPSLKFADVGIAMGQSGSDVAKQASEIILTDDNFATIVRAIREGRRVFSNIQRFCSLLIAGNVGELVCLVLGLAFRDTLGETVFPLSPVAILVNNLLTGTPPAMALGAEKAWPTIMDEPPRSPTSGLFSWEVLSDITFYGFSIGLLSIADFWVVINGFGDGNMAQHCNKDYVEECDLVFRARGAVFATLTLGILLHAYNSRRIRGPMWNIRMLKRVHENKVLFFGFLSGTVLCLLCMYVPGLNTKVLKMKGVGWEWGVVLVTLLIFLILSELYKFGKRKILKPLSIATEEQERLQRIWTETTTLGSINDSNTAVKK
ncbi:Na+/K+ P-type ATPase [Coemansia spiralis]|nr:Na+/K+ P-type ATPase [Coemansia spiralis]